MEENLKMLSMCDPFHSRSRIFRQAPKEDESHPCRQSLDRVDATTWLYRYGAGRRLGQCNLQNHGQIAPPDYWRSTPIWRQLFRQKFPKHSDPATDACRPQRRRTECVHTIDYFQTKGLAYALRWETVHRLYMAFQIHPWSCCLDDGSRYPQL